MRAGWNEASRIGLKIKKSLQRRENSSGRHLNFMIYINCSTEVRTMYSDLIPPRGFASVITTKH